MLGFTWGPPHLVKKALFTPVETQVKEKGKAKMWTIPIGHPPGNTAPEPLLVKALKNWKQTHR
jgi:hypothetical protein